MIHSELNTFFHVNHSNVNKSKWEIKSDMRNKKFLLSSILRGWRMSANCFLSNRFVFWLEKKFCDKLLTFNVNNISSKIKTKAHEKFLKAKHTSHPWEYEISIDVQTTSYLIKKLETKNEMELKGGIKKLNSFFFTCYWKKLWILRAESRWKLCEETTESNCLVVEVKLVIFLVVFLNDQE